MKGKKVKKNGIREGKLVVITGPDGCGKKVQTGLLVKRLQGCGYNTATIDFPQYEANFFGKMVARYLKGEFGKATEISPYLIAILYAGDRFESMPKIDKWLNSGNIVVCDRYLGDNFLHQGSKISDPAKRQEFFYWLEDLEVKIFGARKAYVTFYLDVALEVSLALLKNKDAQAKKTYADGKEDGHENEKHLRAVRKINEELIERYDWVKINCMKDGKLMPPEEIHEIIWGCLRFRHF